MGDMEIPDELIDQLLGEYQGPEQLTGPDGLINQLRRRLIERAVGVELEQHLGYSSGGEPVGFANLSAALWRAGLARFGALLP
jgi:putative transposase